MKKEQNRSVSVATKSDPLLLTLFSIVIISILWVCLHHYSIWGKHVIKFILPPANFLPPVSLVLENLKLAFNGYSGGYARSALGYLVFGMMAASFFSIGGIIYRLIFSFKILETRTEDLNFSEKIALYYILGSLAASLLWMILGSLGALHSTVAVAVAIAGCILLAVQRPARSWKEMFLSGIKQLSLWEKILLLFLGAILIMISANSVRSQSYGDALVVHAVLPNLFINEGSVKPYPYHIHSYLPLNLEMLVMWALLLKSEFAATLLMWGFLAALALLFWGFFKRHTNQWIALMTVIVILSAPIVIHSSVMIKNDFPVALFMVAHYCALVEGFNRRFSSPAQSQRWLLLAGTLCGGAVGHKLTALPVTLFSTLMIVGYDLYCRKKNPETAPWKSMLTFFWIGGLAVTTVPWLVRSLWETGSPLYPYFIDLLGLEPEKPWHRGIRGDLSVVQLGWAGLRDLLRGMFLSNVSINNNVPSFTPPNWGPSLFFVALSLLFLKKTVSVGLRLTMGLALFTWIYFLFFLLDPRYHTAFPVFIVAASFAVGWNLILREPAGKFFKLAAQIAVPFYLVHMFSIVNHWNLAYASTGTMLEGFSPGNYPTWDPQANNMQWLYHIVNTRTQKDDIFLLAGITYGYGIQRKAFLSCDIDKQMIAEIAEKSADSKELGEKIRGLGVRHILITANFYEYFKNYLWEHLRIGESELGKIREFMNRDMQPRFATPDKTVLWYSFKQNESYPPVILNREDAEKFPVKFIEHTQSELQSGRLKEGWELLEIARDAPMSKRFKDYVYYLLSRLEQMRNKK